MSDDYTNAPQSPLDAARQDEYNGVDIMAGQRAKDAAENDAKISSLFNAQQPTPLANYTPTAGNTPQDVAMFAGSTEPGTMALNAAALQKGAPLDIPEQGMLSRGISSQPIPIQNQGTGASIVNPNYTGQVDPAQTPIDTSKISNPYSDAFGAQAAGIKDALNSANLKAAAETQYYDKKGQIELEQQEKQQNLQNAFDHNYQEKMDDFNQAVKDSRALAGDKIIPGAMLARQDTSGALMTGLAVALGGIGGALQGTNQNIGLDMVNKAIDRDVAAQQFNMEYKYKLSRDNVSDQNSLLTKMYQKFGNDKDAVTATKLAMVTMVQDKMNQQITQKGGAMDMAAQGAAKSAMGEVLMRKTALEQQLKQSQLMLFQQQQMAMQLGGDKSKWTDLDIQAYEKLTNDKTVRSRFVPGFGLATNEKGAEAFQKVRGEIEPGLDAMKKMQATVADYNKLNPGDYKKRAVLQSEMGLLSGQLTDAMGRSKRMSADDRKAFQADVLGDPTSMMSLSSSQQAKMQNLMKVFQDELHTEARVHGVPVPLDDISSKVIPNK